MQSVAVHIASLSSGVGPIKHTKLGKGIIVGSGELYMYTVTSNKINSWSLPVMGS